MRKLSDTEYLQLLKRIEARRSLTVALLLVCAAAIFAVSLYYGHQVFNDFQALAAQLRIEGAAGPDTATAGRSGYLIGVAAGAAISAGILIAISLLAIAIQHAVNARRDRMLIACHERNQGGA